MSSRPLLLSLLVSAGFCSPALAQIQLDRFYPPVVSIGAETQIQAEGKFPSWPVKAIVDRDDVKLIVGEKSGQLSLNLPADAAPGIVWVRLIDDHSASKLTPLLIETAATIEEVEPNQKIEEATAVEMPAVVYGRLAKANDIDTYRVRLRKGQTFVATTLAHRPLRSPMDAVMQLADEQGNVLAQADDDRGIDPQLVYRADEDRDAVVRIFAFPEVPTSAIGYAGAASFVYAIRMTDDAYLDHVLPLVQSPNSAVTSSAAFGWNLPAELDLRQLDATNHSPLIAYSPSSLGWHWQAILPNEAIAIAATGGDDAVTAVSLPCIFSGHISQPGQTDRLRFPVQAGTRYEAVVHSRAYGFPLDSVLRVINVADGSELGRNDDVARNQYDAAVIFRAKEAGEVELQVSDLVDGHSLRHAYSVVIGQASPTVALSVGEDQYLINKDGSVEIAVTIARKHGFDQELKVVAEGLPDGIRCEPVVSQAKGDTSKSVKLKITADKAVSYQGPFRITADIPAAEGKPSTSTTFTAAYSLRDAVPIESFWLTAPRGKE